MKLLDITKDYVAVRKQQAALKIRKKQILSEIESEIKVLLNDAAIKGKLNSNLTHKSVQLTEVKLVDIYPKRRLEESYVYFNTGLGVKAVMLCSLEFSDSEIKKHFDEAISVWNSIIE